MTNEKPLVILLTGPAGSGKSTAAEFLQSDSGYYFALLKFAGPIKRFCYEILGMSFRQVDGVTKNVAIPEYGNKTPRHIMQTLGTEWGRKMIDEDIWVNASLNSLDEIRDATGQDLFVFDDARFCNEIDGLKAREDLDVVVINIKPEYEGYEPITENQHASETQVLPWDFQIINSHDEDEFRNQIFTVLSEVMPEFGEVAA